MACDRTVGAGVAQAPSGAWNTSGYKTENYGLFHATCEGDTNWAAFAEAVFARAGKNTRVRHVTSEEYAAMNPASAKRPAYSILDNYMMSLTDGYRMADWESALDEYMQHLG